MCIYKPAKIRHGFCTFDQTENERRIKFAPVSMSGKGSSFFYHSEMKCENIICKCIETIVQTQKLDI